MAQHTRMPGNHPGGWAVPTGRSWDSLMHCNKFGSTGEQYKIWLQFKQQNVTCYDIWCGLSSLFVYYIPCPTDHTVHQTTVWHCRNKPQQDTSPFTPTSSFSLPPYHFFTLTFSWQMSSNVLKAPVSGGNFITRHGRETTAWWQPHNTP